jgi:hypothetical protein
MAKTDTINFRNLIQVALWDEELSGQISDGWWENARPFEHYKIWCRATATVNPKNLGRNFWADKKNYNFTNKELLEVIGDRMLLCCQRVAGEGFTMKMMKAELRDMKEIIQLYQSEAVGTGSYQLGE